MRYKNTNRNGFLLGFIDFFTFGLFFLVYMPLGGLQDELDEILGHRTQRYFVAYLLGIPTMDLIKMLIGGAQEIIAGTADSTTTEWFGMKIRLFKFPYAGFCVITDYRKYKHLYGFEEFSLRLLVLSFALTSIQEI